MKQRISYGKNNKSGADVVVCPAFCDVHVHFREPGRPDKETIASGCRAAAAGGYTCVCPMPNLNPVPDSPATLARELEIISRDSCIDVIPYASITLGRKGLQVVDVAALKGSVVAFSDDGSGVQDERVMRRAMETIAAEGCILAAHCEDNSLLVPGGCIHDGAYARRNGLPGISSESEWLQIERDLRLAGEVGCAYHVCHISTAQSVDLIRRAKDRGVDVTCETGPHYLTLCEDDLRDEGRFKMNPPLRSAADRAALLEGLKDGTIDMIATDHAPHTAEEKSKGLRGSLMGVVGLETAFPVLYTALVRKGEISLEKLVSLMSSAPRERFRLPQREGDRVTIDISTPRIIDSAEFLSQGRSTPFDGLQVYGRVLKTEYNNKTIYEVK
ncbi:MAG: dihydroorotase [Bacteroidales bacterium]|nr:dihydroorotase [Candidatus Cryptobacteroides aphodequi]